VLIPFTAGGFIYIAGSDLIPELHKESAPSRSLMQFIAIILGIAVMLAFTLME
jgi:zinc and cadmium transporter